MSFAAIAAGIGAAGSIAGGMMQGSAAGDAAGQLAFGQAEAEKLYGSAQGQNDKALMDAEAFAQKQYNPWARLGKQATGGLSRYLGYVPEYGVKKPVQPKKVPKGGGAKGLTPASKKEQKKYKNQLAKWEAGREEFKAQQRGTEDFGGYFKGYETPEPKYTPYKAYEQFTDKHLQADPLYETELNENVGAWDKSAASRGSLMSGNTVAGLREITAGGISRARGRHIEDYEQNRGNYLEDYGIGHDEWEGGYERDWNERERKYNALTGMSGSGMQVADRRSGLRTGTARDQVQNRQWSTSGQANARIGQADAMASGQLSQGAAYGNAFNNVGQMAMLYGMGAFDGDEKTGGYAGSPRQQYLMYGLRGR